MFLISLSPVSTAAFRLVDEINQGMDASNERAVMTQLINILQGEPDAAGAGASAAASAAAGDDAPRSQLFIVSPKLLLDMHHSPLIRTEVVFNGAKVGPGTGAPGGVGAPARLGARFFDFGTYAKKLELSKLAAPLKPPKAAKAGASVEVGADDRTLLGKRSPGSRAAASAAARGDGDGDGDDDDDDDDPPVERRMSKGARHA